ncbi:MAG TPA: hypothetical protein DCY27_02450 [Desulfobacterales bacterium]|nr:hypothetical protein [Desulfobacterales bacterium]
MLQWDSQRNPYLENIFVKARIPTHEVRKRRLDELLQASGLTDRKEEVRDAHQRFIAELLTHRTHEPNKELLKGYLQEFGPPSLTLPEPSGLKIALIEPIRFVVLPEKGLDPVSREATFLPPKKITQREPADDIILER